MAVRTVSFLGQLSVFNDTSVFTVHHVVVLLVLKKQYAHVETCRPS